MSLTFKKLPYLEFFELADEPYSISPNPLYLYESPTHRIALEKTKWVIAARRGLALLFGQPGTGKTTLIRELAAQIEQDPAVSYVFITNPNYPTPNQLLKAISEEFEVPQKSSNYLELLRIFKEYLADQALNKRKNLVLLIDEAHTLKPPLLELLRQLMNFESNDQKFLQIVLFAEEQFRVRLHQQRYQNLVSRAAMASTLEPLSSEDSGTMLAYRWVRAGGTEKNFPFTPESLAQLYTYAHGIPRTQIILADNALLSAYLIQQKTIDINLIHDIVKDRGLPDTDPPASPRTVKRHVKKAPVKK